MKKITTYFFAGLGVALAVFFACFLVDSVQVSADVTPDVQLSGEQTLALYGNVINAAYSENNTDWFPCQFTFRGYFQAESTDIYDDDLRGDVPAYIHSMLGSTQFLVYTCDDFVPSFFQNVRFDTSFSIDVSGIARFHQLILYSIPSSSRGSVDTRYDFCANTVSYSATPVTVNPFFYDSIYQYRCYVQYYSTSGPVWFLQNPTFSITEIMLHDVDASTGDEQDFSISGQNLQWHFPYSYDESGSTSGEPASFLLYIGCPIVTDGYILPEPPETTPNYNSRLDTIIDVTSNNNSLLAQILAKLDLIYQKMQQGESSPTLQDPEKIGFDSRTKQEILDGVASADSVLDGVQPSDLPTGASESIWYFWGRLKNIMPPSLWALYLFALVGGFVGWILYGKRGG